MRVRQGWVRLALHCLHKQQKSNQTPMEILQRSSNLECNFLLTLYALAHCTSTGAQSPGPAQIAYCTQQARAHECLQCSNCKLHFQCVHDMSDVAEVQGL